jgi:hypothetical protein
MTLSLSIQLRIKGSNCINYIKKDPSDRLPQLLVEELIGILRPWKQRNIELIGHFEAE